MSDGTHIEWTDATWNPITGCSVVSAGCKHCYAMKLAGTRLRHHPSREGLTVETKAGPVWNGQVRFNEGWLDQPLRWKRPRRIFVCAHGDLFHESVPPEWLDRIFTVMARATHHTFQVLTKRPDRMLNYMMRCALVGCSADLHSVVKHAHGGRWPLPNVWLGVSVEHQEAADERIPVLLQCPAAVRWISAEPLLGQVDLKGALFYDAAKSIRAIDWVVAGGESGPGARPMHPDWARSLRDQCKGAGVAFLFKQWGEWLPLGPMRENGEANPLALRGMLTDRWHGDDAANMAWLRPHGGKKAAGRLLDGMLHDAYPEARPC